LTDLAPLAGMPLTKLEIVGNLELSDLSPLREMKLTALDAGYTAVTDWTPLQGMPLVFLNTGTPISDLSFLQGLPLENRRTTSRVTGRCPPIAASACRRSTMRGQRHSAVQAGGCGLGSRLGGPLAS
jgi:hypothetical protein